MAGRTGWVLTDGAAGMPNFAANTAGLCTRIAATPSPHRVLQEHRQGGAYIALLPLVFDAARWRSEFLVQWPPGSPAWRSYFSRINDGPDYQPAQARAFQAA